MRTSARARGVVHRSLGDDLDAALLAGRIVSDDATFQRLLRAHPEDAATWLVYADWLEAAGEAQRATVVRLHHELLGMTEHVPRLACARRVLDEAKGLPLEWLARFPARRALAGECWGARDCDGGVYLAHFVAGGKLLFKQDSGGGESDEPDQTNGDGRWMQIGEAMCFSIALHDDRKKDYSRQDGVLTGEHLGGIGSNADGQIWTWALVPVKPADFARARLPDLDEPKDSKHRDTGKAKHLLPRRRWK